MRRKTAVLAAAVVLLLVLLLATRTLRGPAAVPAGQRPLLRISAASLADFAAAFDAGADTPRLVLLLSPT